jgi:hypothetical protein
MTLGRIQFELVANRPDLFPRDAGIGKEARVSLMSS